MFSSARPRGPSWVLFAALSAAAHASAFGVVATRRPPPELRFHPDDAPLAGETLDVDPPALPAPEPPADEAPAVSPSPSPTPARAPAPARAAVHAPVADPSSSTNSATSAVHPPELYGAVGVRFAADLATTFTRAFPQAASADPIWTMAPIGSAGTAEVVLRLDEEGHLEGTSVTGAPSAALRKGIERTLALIGSRTFTAGAAITKLRVSARVGRNDVHDGLHGDVFALSVGSATGGSFSGDTGAAFFALPGADGGRRVDVELRLVP